MTEMGHFFKRIMVKWLFRKLYTVKCRAIELPMVLGLGLKIQWMKEDPGVSDTTFYQPIHHWLGRLILLS